MTELGFGGYSMVMGAVFFWFAAFLLGLVEHVLFAMAVYYDAKAKGNRECTMWALLVGFLGLIPGIVYLCVRGNAANRYVFCPNCRCSHPITFPNCPQCGAPNLLSQPFYDPMIPSYAKRARNFLIAGIVAFGVVLVFTILFCFIFLFRISQMGMLH